MSDTQKDDVLTSDTTADVQFFDISTPSGEQICGEDFVELLRCQFEGCAPEEAQDVFFAVQLITDMSPNFLIVVNLSGDMVWKSSTLQPGESLTIRTPEFFGYIEGDCICSHYDGKVTFHASDTPIRIVIPIENDEAIDLYPGESIEDVDRNVLISCKPHIQKPLHIIDPGWDDDEWW